MAFIEHLRRHIFDKWPTLSTIAGALLFLADFQMYSEGDLQMNG